MGYIYKITNKNNNKSYIGQTIKQRPSDRFSQHRYNARHLDNKSRYLHRAMAKNGVDNFSFEIIEKIENDLLNEREKYWIKYYQTKVPNGYNLTDGGEGTKGCSRPQSVEEREKRKKSNIQFYLNNPDKVEEIRNRTKMLWENPEYRKKVTEANLKYAQEHPEMNKGENNPMFGKKHTEEALQKIRANSALRKIKIAKLDPETLTIIEVYDGIKDVEKALGVSHGWLSKAAKQGKKAYGYLWKIL